MNLYQILGVNKDASLEQIKRAYKCLAQIWHPDKHNGRDEKFLEIKEAYEVLKDSKRRELYDNDGVTAKQKAIREKAIELLSIKLSKIISNLSFEGDIIQRIIKDLDNKERELHAEKNKSESNKKIISKQVGRIISTSDLNLFKNLVNEYIAGADRQIENINQNLLLIKEARKILKTYKDSSYEAEFLHRDFSNGVSSTAPYF